MSSTHEGPGTPQSAAPEHPASPHTTTPNQYHLHGGGISVHYFPDGITPVGPGSGAQFTYQDTHRSLTFHRDEIRTAAVPDLGTIVSVTLVHTVDTGNTTFSLLLPHVVLPGETGGSAFIQTEGITTVHRAFVTMIGHAQSEVYAVISLSGTAVRILLA